MPIDKYINDFASNARIFLNNVAQQLDFILISGLLALLALIFFILLRRIRRKYYNNQFAAMALEDFLSSLNAANSLESTLDSLLVLVSRFQQAYCYALYIHDAKSREYILKAVRHPDTDSEQIAPSYSGLFPYRKNATYHPAMNINIDPTVKSTTIVREGEIPLLVMPVIEGKCYIFAGQTSKISPATKETLDKFKKILEPVLNMVLYTNVIKEHVEKAEASKKAVSNISGLIIENDDILNVLVNICGKTAGTAGGLLINNDNGKLNVLAASGLDDKCADILKQDAATLAALTKLAAGKDVVVLAKENSDFYLLPDCFAALDMELFIFFNIKTQLSNFITGFWYDKSLDMLEYRISALRIISENMGDILDYRLNLREMTASNINMLKILAQLMDTVSPYTAGYCDLMYRFALIISRELNLDIKETEDICLAAYLSNIGTLGLSTSLLFKQGKFSDEEYEVIKMHSEAGASIIEAITGNTLVSKYVKHHHERMDGYGYPDGLAGEDIPLGSRVIMVVQTFIAKITGRSGRSPLPFEKAVELLQAASGTQLDKRIVDALINWFYKKQSGMTNKEASLGPCWEMKCAPASICSQCQAYGKTSRNCWEYKATNCEKHGSSCETCYVYSEYLFRKRLGMYR